MSDLYVAGNVEWKCKLCGDTGLGGSSMNDHASTHIVPTEEQVKQIRGEGLAGYSLARTPDSDPT